jgi:DNA-directed RNA polymerase specialized sigma24 family protein
MTKFLRLPSLYPLPNLVSRSYRVRVELSPWLLSFSITTKGRMRKTWSLTQESFEKLLTWLDSNREEAAAKYESIRYRLIKYFVCNGCGDQDEVLTDETLDRVTKKMERDEIPEPFTGDKSLYFLAFAKHIRLEHLSDRKPREIPGHGIDPDETDETEDEAACLEKCIPILPQEDRWLAIEYYRFEKSTKVGHHRKLAEQLGLGLAGLRTRIHRIRERLRPCIEECLEGRSR